VTKSGCQEGYLHEAAEEHCADAPDGSLGKLHPRNVDERGHGVEQISRYVDCSTRVSGDDTRLRVPARPRFHSGDVPMLGVWRALAEQNDGREDDVDADMDHNGKPYDNPEGSRKVQHEDVGADTQLDQSHTV